MQETPQEEKNGVHIPTFGRPFPELTEEERKLAAIKRVARKNVVDAANRYMETRDRSELVRIQELIDALDDAFVLVIPQKDGIPFSVTFNPKQEIPNVETQES